MAWLALFLYLAGAMTAFHHIREAMGEGLAVNSILLGVVFWPLFWPLFWPIMYAVVIVDTAFRRA